jgi:glycosyltransferase involved in cell wall biosynthesis
VKQLFRFFLNRRDYSTSRRIAREVKPDVVFIWHMLNCSIVPILAVQDLHFKPVFALESHWLIHLKKEFIGETSLAKRWYRSSLIGFRKFEELQFGPAIFASDSLKQSHLEAGFDFDNSVTIPNGIPSEWIGKESRKMRSPGQPSRLLFAGRLEDAKGPTVAVKAVDYLVNVRGFRNLKLDLIGKGTSQYIDSLRNLIESCHLKENVQLKGFRPREELIQSYYDYDVLLFPTPQWEGLPVTIIEAMAKGLVVIASDIGGPRDIIKDGQNGFLIPPNNHKELARAIEDLSKAPSLAAELSYGAVQTVRQKYSAEQMLNQYEAFLNSLVQTFNDSYR